VDEDDEGWRGDGVLEGVRLLDAARLITPRCCSGGESAALAARDLRLDALRAVPAVLTLSLSMEALCSDEAEEAIGVDEERGLPRGLSCCHTSCGRASRPV
jgi:hypothetical protein